jgi:RAB6A-GEF complex partner protein 2
MSPYIILRDQARTASVDTDAAQLNGLKKLESDRSADAAAKEFQEYANQLLDHPRENSSSGLLSPTDTGPRRKSIIEGPSSMKETIDLAILRSNATSLSLSSNKFEIARSGRHVAVINLARPSYRLGETITAIIDFSNADIPCYSVLVSLETSERVDPAIALRSNASIYRATRKVHASFVENALFARRLVFTPTIPPNATPEFVTSGISLEWKMRVEFTTPRVTGEEDEDGLLDELLEEVQGDDRGIVLAATERLLCESFEVAVPIRVYGAVITGGGEKGMDEGFVI